MCKLKIDEKTRTVTADFHKLTQSQKEEIKELQGFGYEFVHKAQIRRGEKRGRAYYENKLVESDRRLFKDIENKHSYAKAVSFASMVIKLGKAADSDSSKKPEIDEFREMVLDDFSKAKLFFQKTIAA